MATKTAVKTKAAAKKTSNTKRPAAKRVQTPPSQFGRVVRENLHWLFLGAAAITVGVLLFWGYRRATASGIFVVKRIDVAGENKTAKDAIEKSVRAAAQTSGVWNADLSKMQREVEQLPWVKTASISRVLPDGLRVRITEREPKAVVRLDSGAKMWVDDEARVLGGATADDAQQFFVMLGWNESADAEAARKNQERVRLYTKLQEEWRKLEIAGKVTAADFSNLQDIEALVEQNGSIVGIQLGQQDFGARLKSALSYLDVLSESGGIENIEKIIAYDRAPVARYKQADAAEDKNERKNIVPRKR